MTLGRAGAAATVSARDRADEEESTERRPGGQYGEVATHGGCYLSGSPWQTHAFRTMF